MGLGLLCLLVLGFYFTVIYLMFTGFNIITRVLNEDFDDEEVDND